MTTCISPWQENKYQSPLQPVERGSGAKVDTVICKTICICDLSVCLCHRKVFGLSVRTTTTCITWAYWYSLLYLEWASEGSWESRWEAEVSLRKDDADLAKLRNCVRYADLLFYLDWKVHQVVPYGSIHALEAAHRCSDDVDNHLMSDVREVAGRAASPPSLRAIVAK